MSTTIITCTVISSIQFQQKVRSNIFKFSKIFYLIKLSDTTYIPPTLTSYSIKPSTHIQYVSNGIYIPLDTYIGYSICSFICRGIRCSRKKNFLNNHLKTLSLVLRKCKTFCQTQHPVIQKIKVLKLYNLERLEDSKEGQH